MKYNCADEFDLQEIYRKLTSDIKTPTTQADIYYVDDNELERLQKRMNKLVKMVMKSQTQKTR